MLQHRQNRQGADYVAAALLPTMPVYNPALRLSSLQVDKGRIQRNLVIPVQALPDGLGELVQGPRNGHWPWFTAEGGQGSAVRFIGVDQVPHSRLGGVKGEVISDAAAGVALQGLQNAENIGTAGKQNARNPGCVIGAVGLKLPGIEGLHIALPLQHKVPVKKSYPIIRLSVFRSSSIRFIACCNCGMSSRQIR